MDPALRFTSTASPSTWESVLAHRGDEPTISRVRDQFLAHGVSADVVHDVLSDGGGGLYASISSGREDWSVPFGGLIGAALLAGEVAAYSSHLVARASAVRSVAVEILLEDFSAIAVAGELGVSRQSVYEIARGGSKMREAISRAQR